MNIDTLFLSGCGTKGTAFIGVFQALIEKKIIDFKKIRRYVCCSGSSIIGVLLCCGYNINFIYNLSNKLEYTNLLNLDDLDDIFLNQGLFSNDNIGKLIDNIIQKKYIKKEITLKQFYDLTKIHFICKVYNLSDKCDEYFSYENHPDIKVSTVVESAPNFSEDINGLLNVPKLYYLVEGRPQKFFFESLILVKDIDSYYYVVDGRNLPFEFKARSRYVEFFPKAGDQGTTDFSIKIYTSENHYVGQKIIKLSVNKASCAEPQSLKTLAIGHSIATSWPLLWANKLRKTKNLRLETFGSQAFIWKLPNTTPEMYHDLFVEASSGFSLYTLLNVGENPPGYDANVAGEQLKSPFLFKQNNGLFEIDMPRYKRNILRGVDLDVLILNAGDNDTWNLNLNSADTELAAVRKNAEQLLDEFSTLSPKLKIGWMMPLNYSHNKHIWKLDYKGKYGHWEQKQRRHLFIKLIQQIQKERGDFEIIPTDFSVDGANDYYNFSAAHPPTEATSDYAEQLYAWTMHKSCSN